MCHGCILGMSSHVDSKDLYHFKCSTKEVNLGLCSQNGSKTFTSHDRLGQCLTHNYVDYDQPYDHTWMGALCGCDVFVWFLFGVGMSMIVLNYVLIACKSKVDKD